MSFGIVNRSSENSQTYGHGCKLLHRKEAEQRLSQLVPGSAEHRQLQNALTRIDGIAEISLPTFSYKVCTIPEDQKLLGGFGSCEHVAIGEEVELYVFDKKEPLIMVGATAVKFAHIVALAGDFYAIPGKAISLPGGTDKEREDRFEAAFNTLFKGNPDQVRKVIQEIDGECDAVRHAALPRHCYSHQMTDKNRAIKAIKSDINELLIDNSDHFSENAVDAYKIGHQLALRLAKEAEGDKEKLKYAYAIDAFACHFLTDLFAAGHVRNQRGPLEKFLETLDFSFIPMSSLQLQQLPKKLAGILTGAQHEKDGNDGLNVCNRRGDTWRAYGDGCFFQERNSENKKKVIEATQRSVYEVYEAFLSKCVPTSCLVYDLIPQASDFNPLPLYKVNLEEHTLTLFRGSKCIPIRTALDFLKEGVAQAFRFLPQGYIDGFTDDFLNIPKVHPTFKALGSQGTRALGLVWQILGLPSYHQVSKEFQKVNDKIDEMALILKDTLDGIEKINERLKTIENVLHAQMLFQDIRGPINDINSIVHQHKLYGPALDFSQIDQAEKIVWKAHSDLGNVFTNGTAEGKNILAIYSELLEKSSTREPFERRIAVTLWFRQMLDYQIQAFHLYAIFYLMENRNKTEKEQNERKHTLTRRTQLFEGSITDQIKANKQHIVASLIYCPAADIEAQLQKYRVIHSGPIFDALMAGTNESAPMVLSRQFQVTKDCLKGPVKALFADQKAIKKWLNPLFKQPEIAPVLELAKWLALGFPIGFPGREGAKLSICIGGQKGSDINNNVVHIEAADEGMKPNAFFGIIIRELTRIVAQEVFANGGKPYFNTYQCQRQFQEIRERTEKVQSSLDSLIKNVFQPGNFNKWEWDKELFIRVPQMLITYRDMPQAEGGTGIERLELNAATKDLLLYFRYHFLFLIPAHIKTVLDMAKKPFRHITQ